MKFFVAITALVAVALATPINKPLFSEEAELEAVIAAIQSPNTDPATALLLEQQLLEILGAGPVAVGPAIVESPIAPPGIAVNPIPGVAVHPVGVIETNPGVAIHPIGVIEANPDIAVHPIGVIDTNPGVAVHPVAIVDNTPEINPSPVIVSPGPVAAETSSAPLVQIILNINQEASAVPPVVAEVPVVEPSPVVVVDQAPIEPTPVIVVEQTPIIPDPVILPTPVLPEVVPEPVILPTPVLPEVVPETVIDVEPVIVGTPVLPEPVINLPEELN